MSMGQLEKLNTLLAFLLIIYQLLLHRLIYLISQLTHSKVIKYQCYFFVKYIFNLRIGFNENCNNKNWVNICTLKSSQENFLTQN